MTIMGALLFALSTVIKVAKVHEGSVHRTLRRMVRILQRNAVYRPPPARQNEIECHLGFPDAVFVSPTPSCLAEGYFGLEDGAAGSQEVQMKGEENGA